MEAMIDGMETRFIGGGEYVDRQTYIAVRDENSRLRERIAELEEDRDRWKQRHELNMKVENQRIAELEQKHYNVLYENAHLKAQLDAVKKENNVLRYVIWQHCELADSKIAEACHRFNVPFEPTPINVRSPKALGGGDEQ